VDPLLEKKYGPFDESAPYSDGSMDGPFTMKVNEQLNKYLPVKVQWVLTALIYAGMTFYLYFNFFDPFEVDSLQYKICVFLPLIIIGCLGLPLGIGMVSFFDPASTVIITLTVALVFVTAAYDCHIPYLSAFLGGRIVSYFFECIWRGGSNNESINAVFTAGYAYPFVFGILNTLFFLLYKHDIITEKWRWGFVPLVMGLVWATFSFVDAIIKPQPNMGFSTYKLNKAQYCRLCTLRYVINGIAIIGVSRPLEMLLSSR